MNCLYGTAYNMYKNELPFPQKSSERVYSEAK